MAAELDTLIHEKRLPLRDAFAACHKAHERVAGARTQWTAVAPEALAGVQAEIRKLESAEQEAAGRFRLDQR